MFELKSYGAKIFFSNELRENPLLVKQTVGEMLMLVKSTKVKNILIELDEPNPKLENINIVDIANKLGEHLTSDTKLAIFSIHYQASVSASFLENIIYSRGVPIQYFNSEEKALEWFKSD